MILRARTVVTLDGAPIENGAVAIAGERIIDVGSFGDVRAHHSGEINDLGEQVLLPGLINAHCHLDYTVLRGKIARQESFSDWIRAINAQKEKLGPDDYRKSIAEGLAECLKFGTTSIANFEAFPELIASIESPLRTWWFPELIDVRAPESAQALVGSALASLEHAQGKGLAPHSLYTASVALYRLCQDAAMLNNVLLATHLAESREEMSMFRDASGSAHQFLKSLGRDMTDCGTQTSLSRFLAITGMQGREKTGHWLVVHLNELEENDFDLLNHLSTRFGIVHCPRSHRYFKHSTFPFERLRSLGFNICLGTDSLASNDDLSLFAEMRLFQQEHPAVSSRDIVEMCTINPASALVQADQLGKIKPGFYADLIIIPDRGARNVFDEIVAFDDEIPSVMIGGSWLRA